MTQTKRSQKIEFLILVGLLKKQTTILKLLKQKIKYQVLVVQPQILHYLQLKIKYLMLVIQLKKQILTQIKKKLTDHDHDKYITTLEFNNLAARVFTARLAQAHLITKTDFDDKLKVSIKKLTQTKQNTYLLKMNLTNYKRFVQFILEVKVILKKMIHKTFQYFSQCTDILRGLLILVAFQNRNLKDCVMKVLNLLLHVIIFLILH